MRRPLAAAALAAALAGASGVRAEAPPGREVRIAAASDLKLALDDVLAAARTETADIRPVVTYGSSGSFFAMIENGAPFDLFLSADVDYPRRLAEKGHADGDVFLYAVGQLALWVPSRSPLDPGALGLQALLHPSVRKVAIANPRHAPYGRAAEAALRSAGVLDRVRGKLVLGENVAQAAHFARSGAADAALVSLSLAASPRMSGAGRFVALAPGSHPRLVQGGVVLKRAADLAAARAVRAALLGSAGRNALREHGFLLPEP